MKVNIGLLGILIILIMIFFSFFYFNSKIEKLMEELMLIKSYVVDIDDDIHEIEKNIDK
tara:strand:- start:663 stop:839 length:177 start_codon:yes stop_codon:yes gene_type:complete